MLEKFRKSSGISVTSVPNYGKFCPHWHILCATHQTPYPAAGYFSQGAPISQLYNVPSPFFNTPAQVQGLPVSPSSFGYIVTLSIYEHVDVKIDLFITVKMAIIRQLFEKC